MDISSISTDYYLDKFEIEALAELKIPAPKIIPNTYITLIEFLKKLESKLDNLPMSNG